MSRRTLLLLATGIGVLLALLNRENRDDPSVQDRLAKKYRGLVQELVSPNEKPTTRNRAGGSVTFPAGYGVKAQEHVASARQVLYDHFEEALPFLIDGLDDHRYSMTIDWAGGDAYYNYSVGHVCRDIIASQLEVYRDRISFSGPSHWHRYDYGPINREWWHDRAKRSLAELQVEAIDWAIERCRTVPDDEVHQDRMTQIAHLKELRDEITKSGKPAKPRKMLPMVTSDR